MGADQKWKDYRDEFLGCEGPGCIIYQAVKVPKGWSGRGKGSFFCGICAGNKIRELEGKVKVLEEEVKSGEEKGKEEVRSFAETVQKSLEREMEGAKKRIEKESEAVREEVEKVKEVVKVEVKRTSIEEVRKKRVMVFGLKKKEGRTDEEMIGDMLQVLGRKEECKPRAVFRMREKEGESSGTRPVVVEFGSEQEKWKVLERKMALRRDDEFARVFLELDLLREEREVAKNKRVERKKQKEREEGGKSGGES
ncbi:hypothetical protein CAPTEDRAFT_195668 [Capitella teleta]|uniref:Uncharacterized protein n=1 Tax=Capitella teleta TaxID=283909 RepID=X1ZVC8_CAPTE|nr:hypothetical protein CAPTEDRAFT_195668 [Capitella teleta]|eukprot:ELT88382.1 hypothetical protein CAPTEDRAFT_195668 [Capitella teleta]